MSLLRCPHCRVALRVAATQTPGTILTCSACKKRFRLGAPPPPRPQEEVLDVLPAGPAPGPAPGRQERPPTPAAAAPVPQRRPPPPAAEPLLVEAVPKPAPAARVAPRLSVQPAVEEPALVQPVEDEPVSVAAGAVAEVVAVTVQASPPGGAPRRARPRFTDDQPAARRRHPTNRAAVVSGVIAGVAAILWLLTVFELVGWFTGPSSAATLAAVFLGSVFGGMFTATSTGVARFRHSLYAGLATFGALLLLAVPGALLMLWLRSQLQQFVSPSAFEDGNALDVLRSNLGRLALLTAVAPFFLVTGFLLGGALDVLMTAAARGVLPRQGWTYHTRDGKSFPVYGPWRNPVLAAGWSVVGWALLLTCWVPFVVSLNLLGVLAAFALGQACRTLARKHNAVSARAALEKDRRAPIVYLRSFQDDGLFQPGTFFLVNDWLRTLSEKTAEENLSTALAPFGPVVAIGRPEEEMPEVGAARIYVGDDHWQDLIRDLVSDRGAVAVFQAGGTPGLRWELETVGTLLRPEYILMFLPFALHWSRSRRDAGYASFRAWAAECAPAELPGGVGDGVYFFYFTARPAVQTHVLERGAAVPGAHPLGEVLRDLQTGHKLRPWRLLNLRRLFKLWLWGLLLVAPSMGIRALWHWSRGAESSPPAAPPMASVVAREGGPKAGQPPAPLRPVRVEYQGRAMPYKVRLSERWKEAAQPHRGDRKFDIPGGPSLSVLVVDSTLDLNGYPAEFVAGLRKSMQKVEPLEERRTERQGQTWLELKVRFTIQEGTGWMYVRAWSGTKQSVVLIAAAEKDDDASRQVVQEALDGFELPEGR